MSNGNKNPIKLKFFASIMRSIQNNTAHKLFSAYLCNIRIVYYFYLLISIYSLHIYRLRMYLHAPVNYIYFFCILCGYQRLFCRAITSADNSDAFISKNRAIAQSAEMHSFVFKLQSARNFKLFPPCPCRKQNSFSRIQILICLNSKNISFSLNALNFLLLYRNKLLIIQ